MKWANAQIFKRRISGMFLAIIFTLIFTLCVECTVQASSVNVSPVAGSKNNLTSKERTTSYADSLVSPQANWIQIETEHFIIYAPKGPSFQEIGKQAENIYNSITPRFRYSNPQKISLYIYTDRSRFIYGSPSIDAAGYTFPEQNIIAILQGAGNSSVTLAHEITHIAFIRSVPRIDTVPQWFIEGLAIYESQPGIEVQNIEKYALARDIPVFIGTPNAEGQPQLKDYAQGYLMVSFIVSKYSPKALNEIIYRLQNGQDYTTAVLEALAKSPIQLNEEWQQYARNQLIYIWIAQIPDLIWYGLTFLFVIAVIVASLRNRRRLRLMEDLEDETDLPYDDPRYTSNDYGPGTRV